VEQLASAGFNALIFNSAVKAFNAGLTIFTAALVTYTLGFAVMPGILLPVMFVAPLTKLMGSSVLLMIGFLLTIFLLIAKIFFMDFQPGFATTISLITFFAGIQILVIGVASLYIGRILKEVQNRPLYIVRDTYNFNNKE
jgi:glycosyltransferase involved in cell wall biosynthesis